MNPPHENATQAPRFRGDPGISVSVETTLSFRTPSGQRVSYPARLGPELPHDPGPAARTRMVVVADGWTLVQHRWPVEAVTVAGTREAVEREAGAAVAIHRAVEGGPYADAFLPLAGYELDDDEPFLLYVRPDGRPLDELAGRLPIEEWPALLRGLLAAVRLLDGLGLAHRDITPAGVRWNGTRARLGRATFAEQVGRPRRATGQPPYASPEQCAGTGLVDSRDDVWSAARVAYFAITGRPGPAEARPVDLAVIPALRPLQPAFAARAAERPTAAEVLRRLSHPDPALSVARDPGHLEAGRQAFEAARLTKRIGAVQVADDPVGDRRRGWRGWFGG